MSHLKITPQTLSQSQADLNSIKEHLDLSSIATALSISEVLASDIITALFSPNIDPRTKLAKAKFSSTISSIEDLKPGKIIEGIVRNIVDFGAFIDIGVKNDGLVHISEISNTYVSDVSTVLSLGDIKKFKIIDIDVDKGRVGLSLKQLETTPPH